MVLADMLVHMESKRSFSAFGIAARREVVPVAGVCLAAHVWRDPGIQACGGPNLCTALSASAHPNGKAFARSSLVASRVGHTLFLTNGSITSHTAKG